MWTAKEIHDQPDPLRYEIYYHQISKHQNQSHLYGNATQLSSLKTTLQQDTKHRIAKVLQTIHALNQQFTKVMDCLPTNQPQAPAHKKFKGLAK